MDTVTILSCERQNRDRRFWPRKDTDDTVHTYRGTYTVTGGAITHFDVRQTS